MALAKDSIPQFCMDLVTNKVVWPIDKVEDAVILLKQTLDNWCGTNGDVSTAIRILALATVKEVEASLLERTRVPIRVIQDVFPGDVWFLSKHRDFACRGFKVRSVNKEKNRVEFCDGGWDHYDSILHSGEWVLLGRLYEPGIEEQVK